MEVPEILEKLSEASRLLEQISQDVSPEHRSSAFTAILTALLLQKSGSHLSKRVEPDVSDFIRKYGFRSFTDVVLGLAYFFLHSQGKNSFTVSEMREAYRITRRPEPANFNNLLDNLADKRLVKLLSQKKEGIKGWVISPKGEEYVEALMASQ